MTRPRLTSAAPIALVQMLRQAIDIAGVPRLELAEACAIEPTRMPQFFDGRAEMSIDLYNRMVDYIANFRIHLIKFDPQNPPAARSAKHRECRTLTNKIFEAARVRGLGANAAGQIAGISGEEMTSILYGNSRGFTADELHMILACIEQVAVPHATQPSTNVAIDEDLAHYFVVTNDTELYAKVSETRVRHGMPALTQGDRPTNRAGRRRLRNLARALIGVTSSTAKVA